MTCLIDDEFINKFKNMLSEELLLHFGYGSKQYYITCSDTSITLRMKTHIAEFSYETLQEIRLQYNNEFLPKFVKSFISDLVLMY